MSGQPAGLRQVDYRMSTGFAPLLDQVQASVLITTYESGHLAVVGTHGGQAHVSLHRFEHAMGMALNADRLAIGTRNQIWQLHHVREMASRLEPTGRYDDCWLARHSHFTGQIDGHELAWVGNELWGVNTLFSCIYSVVDEVNFAPRWQPPFITVLAAEDRCHLNGITVIDGKPRYVSCLGRSDTAEGWRPNKLTGGSVLEIPSGNLVATGLCLPHSPRWYDNRLWILNSGRGEFGTIDLQTGTFQAVEQLPGYARGLAFYGPLAFVGLSKVREHSTFGGLPLTQRGEPLRCGVAVVDLRSGKSIAYFEFVSGVDEVFDVQVLPQTRNPYIAGPHPTEDGQSAVWIIAPKREWS